MPFTPTRFRARSQADRTHQLRPPPRARSSSPVPTPPNPRALERQLRREAWLARLFSLTHPFRSRSTDFPVDDPEIITRARTEQRRKAGEGKKKAARGVLHGQQAKLKADLATVRERLERSKSALHALRKRKAELERWLVENNNHASHTQRFKAAQARLLVVQQRMRQAEEAQLNLERRGFTLVRLVAEEARRSSSGSPKHANSAKKRHKAVPDFDLHSSPIAPAALPADLVERPRVSRRWSMTNAMPRRAMSDKPPRRASTSFLFGSRASLDAGAVLSVYDDGPKRYTL